MSKIIALKLPLSFFLSHLANRLLASLCNNSNSMKNIIVTIYLIFLYALLFFWTFAISIAILWNIGTEYPLIDNPYNCIISFLISVFIFCSIRLTHRTKRKHYTTIKDYVIASVPFYIAILLYISMYI